MQSSVNEPEMVKIDKLPWGGWPNCYKIANGEVDLIVTSDIGPRIMRYGFIGGQNLFKNVEESMGKSGEPEWMLRGGHRIWAAPEEAPRTYAPDNGPVDIRITGDILTATQPVELTTGLQKEITIKLASAGTAVEVIHRMKNTLCWEITVAAWSVSMMAQRGVGITGFPPRGKHPDILPPTHPLVMWAFTDLTDPRWKFTRKYVMLRQDPANAVPQKIGHFNPKTWGAYLLGTDLFIKRTDADPTRSYPDFGCSYETFTRDDMLEIETLGPMTRLAPGASLEHIERWTLHRDVRIRDFTDDELDEVVAQKL
jgi:hypothetical protein